MVENAGSGRDFWGRRMMMMMMLTIVGRMRNNVAGVDLQIEIRIYIILKISHSAADTDKHNQY